MKSILDKCIQMMIVALMIILSPVLMALSIFQVSTNGFSRRCKYHKICSLYSKEKEACSSGGEYQVGLIEVKKADCYNWMEEFNDYHS